MENPDPFIRRRRGGQAILRARKLAGKMPSNLPPLAGEDHVKYPQPYDIAKDRRALVLVRALLADPRNPHLVPALIDYLQRAEQPREARILAESPNPLAVVAEMFHSDPDTE